MNGSIHSANRTSMNIQKFICNVSAPIEVTIDPVFQKKAQRRKSEHKLIDDQSPYNIFLLEMKFLSCLAALLLLFSAAVAQQTSHTLVYEPFSQEELNEVSINPSAQVDPLPENYPSRPHNFPKHPPMADEHGMMPPHDDFIDEELTEEEVQERKHHRKTYNKMFKWGMIIGTGVLAFILIKFCIAKRRRNHAIRRQMQQRQPQIQMQQHNLQTVSPYIYPVNQPVQMGRPCSRQMPQMPQMQRPCQPEQPQVQRCYQPQPAPQVIRGRPHDSFIRQQQAQAQAQAQSQHVEAQIKYHEMQIQRLRELAQCEERYEMRREIPVNTTQSFESAQPIRKRPIPVGQPIYDCNSSFASEYPEI